MICKFKTNRTLSKEHDSRKKKKMAEVNKVAFRPPHPTDRPGYCEFREVGNQAFSCLIVPYASLLKQQIVLDKNNLMPK